jgi:D-xylonolactonase
MDIPDGHLFRYDVRRDTTDQVLEGPVLGAMTLQRDGSLAVLGIHGGVWLWRGELHTAMTSLAGVEGTRFNDALADPMGRILSGTMPTSGRSSALYSLEPNAEFRVVVPDLGQSNGMALSEDRRTLYHVDTRAGTLRAYAYEVDTGDVGASTVIAWFPERDGVPDGLAMDEDGCLWVAMWGSGRVLRLDQGGRTIGTLQVGTPLVSSIAFGGPDLSDLYITTAGGDDRGRNGPLAGSLFRAAPGVRGLPRQRSALAPG